MNERTLALAILFLVVLGLLYQNGGLNSLSSFSRFGSSFFSGGPKMEPLTEEEFEELNSFHPADTLSTRDYVLAGVGGDSSQSDIYRYARTVESLATSSVLTIGSLCTIEPIVVRSVRNAGIILRNTDKESHTVRINSEDFSVAGDSSILASGIFSSNLGIFSYYCDDTKGGVVFTIPADL